MKFSEWLPAAMSGQKFVYYTGISLAAEVERQPRGEAAFVKHDVWRAVMRGDVTPLQRPTGETDKHGRRLFQYFAVRGSFIPPNQIDTHGRQTMKALETA